MRGKVHHQLHETLVATRHREPILAVVLKHLYVLETIVPADGARKPGTVRGSTV